MTSWVPEGAGGHTLSLHVVHFWSILRHIAELAGYAQGVQFGL